MTGAIEKLHARGFRVRVADGGGLEVWPTDQLTEPVRQWIGRHKTEIIRDLTTTANWFRKGLSQEQSQHLMQLLRVRDADHDDRISCAECQSFYLMRDEMHCKQGRRPVGYSTVYTLHRCTSFKRG